MVIGILWKRIGSSARSDGTAFESGTANTHCMSITPKASLRPPLSFPLRPLIAALPSETLLIVTNPKSRGFRGEVRFEPPTRLVEFSDSIDWEASQAGRTQPDRARTGILRCSPKSTRGGFCLLQNRGDE